MFASCTGIVTAGMLWTSLYLDDQFEASVSKLVQQILSVVKSSDVSFTGAAGNGPSSGPWLFALPLPPLAVPLFVHTLREDCYLQVGHVAAPSDKTELVSELKRLNHDITSIANAHSPAVVGGASGDDKWRETPARYGPSLIALFSARGSSGILPI